MCKSVLLLNLIALFCLKTFVLYGQDTPVNGVKGTISFSVGEAPKNIVAPLSSIRKINHPLINAVTALSANSSGQTVNNGLPTLPVNLQSTGCLYNWTNDTPGIGLAASGAGNIPSFTAINNTGSPITATITANPQPSAFAYVCNLSSDNVSVIATAINKVIATIPVGGAPYGVSVSPDGSLVYVTNSGSNTVSVISTASNAVIATIPVDSTPEGVVVSPDGKNAYVANNLGSTVSVISTATNKVVSTIPLSYWQPTGITISPDGNTLYLACGQAGQVIVVDIASATITAAFLVQRDPFTLVVTPDGKFLYVTDQYGHISVIRTADNFTVKTIDVGATPAAISISPDGKKVYFVDPTNSDLYVIDTSTNTVINSVPVPGSPQGISITADGNFVYMCDRSNNVHVVNTATLAVTATIPVGNYPISMGNFITQTLNCNTTSFTYTFTVMPAAGSVITSSGSPGPDNTSYGIPSPSSSFTVTGTTLSAGIIVTPPPAFEVSSDNVNFSSTISVGSANNNGPFTVYIRLAGTTNADNYSGNIVLSTPGAQNVNVPMPNSTVAPAPINVRGTYSKIYGDVLTDFTLYNNVPGYTSAVTGLYNGNTFKSINIAFGNGSAATDNAGTYPGSIIFSNFEGDNGFIASNYALTYFPVDLVVQPAASIITANNVAKPYGATLSNVAASTNFTITGMKNNETVGNVAINYINGATATAAPGTYAGSVIPSGAASGTFSPANYSITYKPGNLDVIAPPPPVINSSDLPSPMRTIYGTPSPVTSVPVSGINLTAMLLATADAGFEISTDNSNFFSSLTFTPDGLGAVASMPIYIRLTSTASVGNHTGNLTLSSTGANTANLSLTGLVAPAPLTINGSPVIKTYGVILQNNAGSTSFTATGLQNSETVGSVTLAYGGGSAAGDPVGVYSNSVVLSDATGGSFNADNYQITYAQADITVVQAPLTITADNKVRAIATSNPVFTATYAGFVNNEGPAQLTTLPVFLTTALLTSPSGQFPITVSGASSSNYNFSYIAGVLTVYTDPQSIKVPNTFTPNGDGINDLWNIRDLQYYPTCAVEIYNRYGQHLYHSIGYGQAWDGTYDKKPLPVGTYYYIISLNDASQVKLSGYVTIVK